MAFQIIYNKMDAFPLISTLNYGRQMSVQHGELYIGLQCDAPAHRILIHQCL